MESRALLLSAAFLAACSGGGSGGTTGGSGSTSGGSSSSGGSLPFVTSASFSAPGFFADGGINPAAAVMVLGSYQNEITVTCPTLSVLVSGDGGVVGADGATLTLSLTTDGGPIFAGSYPVLPGLDGGGFGATVLYAQTNSGPYAVGQSGTVTLTVLGSSSSNFAGSFSLVVDGGIAGTLIDDFATLYCPNVNTGL